MASLRVKIHSPTESLCGVTMKGGINPENILDMSFPSGGGGRGAGIPVENFIL